MAKIDIIITHWNEPLEVGKKLFQSIAIQECYNHDDINLIIVQDGPQDNPIDWESLLCDCPIDGKRIKLKEHSGVGPARNAGIQAANSDWIMFVDFDDVISDTASFAMTLSNFPVTDDLDVIWSKYMKIKRSYGRYDMLSFSHQKDMDPSCVGKIYRRKFLSDNNILFPTVPELQTNAEFIFNMLVISVTEDFKIANMTNEFYPFCKRYRADGAFSTLGSLKDRIDNIFLRDKYIVQTLLERKHSVHLKNWVIRCFADAYYKIASADAEPELDHGITPELLAFWDEWKTIVRKMSDTDIEIVVDESETEALAYIQDLYNNHGLEYYLQNDIMSFHDFLDCLDNMLASNPLQDATKDDSNVITAPEKPSKSRQDRVVVYCGTKEVYINMIASVKSLLATTPVDKIYFLIEDDTFPYDLPDIVETVNVKNNHPFVSDGPNFENCWTYMCLMRTAFPQMFPQYDKILSLDIDVVINDNVSDLWDINLDDYYFSGVEEPARIKNGPDDYYANFGVIMMNLKKLRDDGLAQKLVDAVNTEHFGCPEQDAFNKYCKGHIHHLSNDYNVTPYSHITGEAEHERIIHYAGLRYWKHFGPVKKYNNLTWAEIMERQVRLHE